MVLLRGWWRVRVGRDFEGEGLGEFYKDSGRVGVLEECHFRYEEMVKKEA